MIDGVTDASTSPQPNKLCGEDSFTGELQSDVASFISSQLTLPADCTCKEQIYIPTGQTTAQLLLATSVDSKRARHYTSPQRLVDEGFCTIIP